MKAIEDVIKDAEPRPAVYVLSNKEGTRSYTGACRNLARRLGDHQQGKASRTRSMRPLNVRYIEYQADYSQALKREKYLKSGTGRDWLTEQSW